MAEAKSGTRSLTAPVTIRVDAPDAKEPEKAKAKAPASKPAEKSDKPAVAKKAKDVVASEFTFDGVRAIDTITDDDDTVRTVARDASFEEQIAVLAPLVLEQAVGIVHLAASGTVEAKGDTITITLVPR